MSLANLTRGLLREIAGLRPCHFRRSAHAEHGLPRHARRLFPGAVSPCGDIFLLLQTLVLFLVLAGHFQRKLSLWHGFRF